MISSSRGLLRKRHDSRDDEIDKMGKKVEAGVDRTAEA